MNGLVSDRQDLKSRDRRHPYLSGIPRINPTERLTSRAPPLLQPPIPAGSRCSTEQIRQQCPPFFRPPPCHRGDGVRLSADLAGFLARALGILGVSCRRGFEPAGIKSIAAAPQKLVLSYRPDLAFSPAVADAVAQRVPEPIL